MPYGLAEFRLSRMRQLLARLGNPQKGLPIVHVAGTKGKGSTSAALAAVLSAAGYRTGLFTSPHLERIEERIAVDGLTCPPAQLAALLAEIRPVVEALDRRAARRGGGRIGPTYFEVADRRGPPALRPRKDRPGCVGGRAGRPPGRHQRLHPRGLHHCEHQLRSHPAVGQYAGRHRGREGRHRQARRAGR